MKKLYIGTNTKMYKNRAETVEYICALQAELKLHPEELEVFIIPSFTSLESAQRALPGSRIILGAQNMGWEESGPYTGEISPLMLIETGVTLVEIGHSERRHILGETDEQVNRKVCCALRNQLKVLLCIGETAREKQDKRTEEILAGQLVKGLMGVKEEQVPELMIAYEPVWAIGENGVQPEYQYVEKSHGSIRNILVSMFGGRGREIPVLYGGSVNADNAEGLIGLPEIDGLFIGRSAWDASGFGRIIRSVYRCWKEDNTRN